jgi:hypothetical protein
MGNDNTGDATWARYCDALAELRAIHAKAKELRAGAEALRTNAAAVAERIRKPRNGGSGSGTSNGQS